MGPFREEWKKKEKNPTNSEEGKEGLRNVKIKEVSLPGLESSIVFYDGYDAYFLKDLEKVKLETEYEIFDQEGEEWKEGREIEEFTAEINEKIKEHIKTKGDKPFEIGLKYGLEEKLKQLISSKDSYGRFFYIPKSYKSDVEKFNDHVEKSVAKEASQDFADLVKDINLN